MSADLEPLVSIITPLYNSEKYIGSTIDSVLNQTYQNWEMFIVDDGSTDKSVQIVKGKIEKDSRIKLLKLERNTGMPYIARNLATEYSKGKFIAFLDSDDLWLPDKLKKQINFMQELDCEISFTAYSKIYEHNHSKRKTIKVPALVGYKDILKTNHIGCLTAIYNVEKLGKLFQTNHKYEDYIMWLEALKKGANAYGLNEVLAQYRVHSNSISTNKFKMALVTWNIYRKIMRLNLFQSLWYFFNYCLNGLKKI